VVQALAARRADVRALIRRPEQAEAIELSAAKQFHVGNFEDADALAAATSGVSAIYHICPNVSANELAYARAVAAAALVSGVRRVVFHSVLHPQIEAMPHHWQKMRAEELLLTFGFDLTILQPTAYMQNILGGWRDILERGVYRIPFPAESRISLVDLNDVAEAAARLLTEEGHDGATYELAGTVPLSQSAVAAAIGLAVNKPIRVEVEHADDWEARAEAAGIGQHERTTLAAMFRYYARHGLAGNPKALTWLLGRTPNDLATFLERSARGEK
jgi:NAD(P)H dehydrogenase (quinone)